MNEYLPFVSIDTWTMIFTGKPAHIVSAFKEVFV